MNKKAKGNLPLAFFVPEASCFERGHFSLLDLHAGCCCRGGPACPPLTAALGNKGQTHRSCPYGSVLPLYAVRPKLGATRETPTGCRRPRLAGRHKAQVSSFFGTQGNVIVKTTPVLSSERFCTLTRPS